MFFFFSRDTFWLGKIYKVCRFNKSSFYNFWKIIKLFDAKNSQDAATIEVVSTEIDQENNNINQRVDCPLDRSN